MCFFKTTALGQCQSQGFVWNRIIYLRDSSNLSPGKQKEELVKYLAQMGNCPYKNDSTNILLLQRIGWLSFLQKEYNQSLQYTNAAINMVYSNIANSNVSQKQLVKIYNNLRIICDTLGLSRMKNHAIDSCIAVGVRLQAYFDTFLPLLLLKTIDFFGEGDYYNTINYSDLGETICVSDVAYASYYQYQFYTYKINSLIFLQKFQDATLLLNAIEPKYKELNELGPFYAFYARMFEEKGEEQNSVRFAERAVHNYLSKKEAKQCSQVYNNLGYILYSTHKKDYNSALKYYFKALVYADNTEALNIYENIAAAYSKLGAFDSAHYFFQRSFDQIKPGINENDLLKSPEQLIGNNITEYVSNLLLDKGDAYLREYSILKDQSALKKALSVYRAADGIFNFIRSRQTETGSKLFWRQNWHHLYEQGIEASLLQNNVEAAFYFFEKSKAVILNDELKERETLSNAQAAQLFQLQNQLSSKEEDLRNFQQFPEKYAEAEKGVFAIKQAIHKIREELKAKNPLYYESLLDTGVISIADVRKKLLAKDQSLLEMFSGDSAVYELIITPQKTFFEKLNKKLFESLSSSYLFYLSNPALLNQHFWQFQTVSHQLYQLIFQHVQQLTSRLIVSPDIDYFPFETLVTSLNPLNYFLNEYAVSYTYSVSYLLDVFNNQHSNDGYTFLGFAPVRFNKLPQLNNSDASLKKIQGLFDSPKAYCNYSATKNNFSSNFYNYKIIQLYTHASDSDETGEPVIYFSDSSLHLPDLLAPQKPVTQLVVLSGCQTASGRLYSGEGVFSFNRSFAALGIPSTVSNLWQVNDQTTYQLTELFYKYLSQNLPLDVALQKAKKEFIRQNEFNEYKLPAYWASSVLIGKTDAISPQRKSDWKLAAILGLTVIALIFLWVTRRKKESKVRNNKENSS